MMFNMLCPFVRGQVTVTSADFPFSFPLYRADTVEEERSSERISRNPIWMESITQNIQTKSAISFLLKILFEISSLQTI